MGIHSTNMGLRGRTITWKHNGGFCLNLHNDAQENGGVINLWEKNRHQSQRWMIIPVSRCGEVFRVHYAANPKFVLNLHENAHSNGATINLWEQNGHESQNWTVVNGNLCHAGNPGFCINVHCALEENGCEINLWERNDHYSQLWKGPSAMAKHAKGSRLKLKDDTGFGINLHCNNHANEGIINLWEANDHESQNWLFEPVDLCGDDCNKAFRIRSAGNPDFCINLHCNSGSNEATINLWEVNDHISQMWILKGHNICHAEHQDFCINLHCMNIANEGVVNLWERNGHDSQKWKGVPKWLGEDSSDSSSDDCCYEC